MERGLAFPIEHYQTKGRCIEILLPYVLPWCIAEPRNESSSQEPSPLLTFIRHYSGSEHGESERECRSAAARPFVACW